MYSFENILKVLAYDYFLFLELAVSAYVYCPLRCATTGLLFISKILIFEVES